MKSIVITVLACATAITCVLLLVRVQRTPEQPRYQLYGLDETSSTTGKTVKSVYRVDTITGRTWRVSSSPLQTGAGDAQHKPVVAWADAWEEMPESPEAAVAKEQAGWQRALEQARATGSTQPAQPSVTPP
jgi:hypothetical protein